MPKRLFLCVALGFGIIAGQSRAQFVSSGKASVRPIQTTDRCKTLDRMLEKNGFAVTTRQFPQMFLAYIKHPGRRYRDLPPFITTDSAWHTYQVLLEAGVKRMEQRQAVRLKAFSRRLLAHTTEATGEGRAGFNKIANYASIALAIQDEAHANKISNAQKDFLATLKQGAGLIRGPVGFPISASVFRARSFYTSSPLLSDYFTARQWYAMVVFPVNDKDATSLAGRLAILIDSDDQLSNLWIALSEPYDSLLGKTEDGDVTIYAAAVHEIVGKDATLVQTARSAEALQKHLKAALPNPQVNDQLLAGERHANFPEVIKGFRILPPRRLTWSVCFQKTIPPGASFPSALHFMVACKQMRSPAAVRALQQKVGDKEAVRIQQVDPGKLSDSLHGRAMKLISTLQKPPPAEAPKAMKTTAWSDKQLWTQLGAWAQQGHTWTLHAKAPLDSWGSPRGGDVGMVSPYPEFFESLATLTRQTAKALSAADTIREKDVRSISEILLAHAKVFVSYRSRYDPELTEQEEKQLEEARSAATRMRNFLEECISRHRTLFDPSQHLTEESVLKYLQELARKCIETGKASENDLKILNAFAQPDILTSDRIDNFASACDSLAVISRKQLARKPLDKRENGFLRGYGLFLGLCHLYKEASWKNVQDDSPIISPIFVSPLAGRTLYAALGRPRELLVRAKLNGDDTLMRGAVLSYREFTLPVYPPLDDESWRQIVRKRQSVPKPPDFTKSFIARPDEGEFVEMLGEGKLYLDVDNIPGRKVTRALIKLLSTAAGEDKSRLIKHLRARCTAEDVPVLIKLMRESPGSLFATQREGCFYEMTDLVSSLPCKSGAAELMEMLTGDNTIHAHAAAEILSRQPKLIDSARLTSRYDKFPTSKRGLCCFVLGYSKKVDQTARDTMLKALSDRDACLRWQGAVSLGQSGTKHPKIIKALSERVDDSNVYVAGEALQTLNKLKASPDAKTLLDTLKRRFRTRNEGSPIDFARSAIGAPWQKWMEYPETGGLFDPGYPTFDEEFSASWSEFPYYESAVTLPVSLDEVILNRLVELKHKPAIPVILEITARNGFTKDVLGIDALMELDGSNYVGHLVKLGLDEKASPWSRATALKRLFSYKPPATICRQLIPVLGDKTPVTSRHPTGPRTLGDLMVILIAKAVFPNETFRDPDVFDEDTGYTEEFKKLTEKVLKWSRTTTRPPDK